VAVKVQAQTDQIKKMYDDLYEIDDMLGMLRRLLFDSVFNASLSCTACHVTERSTKILKRMLRNSMSSKYVWILIFFVLCGVGAIIGLQLKN